MLKTSYYDKFECIGSKCSNSCCIGWTIDLDMNTFVKYLEQRDSKIKNNLIKHPKPSLEKFGEIKRNKDNRCSFLNKDNLCHLQKKYSKDFLSPTCSNFPRRKMDFGSSEILSGTIGCPEVSRLLFSEKDNLKIVNNQNKEVIENKIKIIPKEYRNDLYAINGEKIFNLLYGIFNNNNMSLEVCLFITNQIIKEIDHSKFDTKQLEDIFSHIKKFFIKYKFEKIENASNQVKFIKGFFLSFLKGSADSKLSKLIKKIYINSYSNLSHEKIVDNFIKQRDTIFKKFLIKNSNVFKKFFIHEFFGRVSFLTNENMSSKETFNVILFTAVVSRLILISMAMTQKKLTITEFIDVISMVSRYFDAKEELGQAERILINSGDEDFTNLFYLFVY